MDAIVTQLGAKSNARQSENVATSREVAKLAVLFG
jgi:hypothetical protein